MARRSQAYQAGIESVAEGSQGECPFTDDRRRAQFGAGVRAAEKDREKQIRLFTCRPTLGGQT